ncbi:hypothetical protein BGX38DRAFT_1267317 [Terfezia claveryi]|nr:hypothetical protein BGX38DRAFT_1267317 [Terfezia claveryi]
MEDHVLSELTSISKPMSMALDSDKTACIVCLVDLPETSSDFSASDSFDQIARLIPCNHAMHNSCLAPWVERANSCPICRQSFNKVKLSNTLLGVQIGEYEVEDRVQRPDNEQTFFDEDLFDEATPCLLCNEATHEEFMLLCDGCDGPFHTFCCELEEVPSGTWYCPFCLNLETEPSTSAEGTTGRRGRSRAGGSNQRSSRNSETRRARPRRRTQRNVSAASRIRYTNDGHGNWARVWQDVWSHLNRDMDRVQGEQDAEATALREWSRRAEIAQAQGDGYSGFTAAAPSIIGIRWSRPRERVPVDSPASPEAIAAWGAFDEFRRQEARSEQSTSRKRRTSKVSTPSPKATQDTTEPERKHKRPRTRPSSTFIHPPTHGPSPVSGPCTSSANTEQRTSVFGSWLSKLDGAGTLDASSLERSDHGSPPLVASPAPRVSSTSPTATSPKARATLPFVLPSSPPWSRPHSPVTASTPPDSRRYSLPASSSGGPSSPIQPTHSHRLISPENSPRPSPTHLNLSMKSKEEIQAMVRAALWPHYKAKKVNTEQYTEINKAVSRYLYQVVGSPENGFSPAFIEVDEEMDRLRKMAEQEVMNNLRSYC